MRHQFADIGNQAVGPAILKGGKQAGEPQLSAWRESQAAQVRGAQAEPSGLPKVSRGGLGTESGIHPSPTIRTGDVQNTCF